MITLTEAKQKQTELQKEANELLKYYEIEKLLSKYGEVTFEGSYATGLMVQPDIDITVINPDISAENIIKLGNTLFLTDGINRALMCDYTKIKRHRAGIPFGYYVLTKIIWKDRRWEFDIWLMPEKPEGNKTPGLEEDDWLEKRTREEKDAMLLLKAQLWEMGKYGGTGYASYHVYRAVIEGVRTVDEFLEWMKQTYDWTAS